MPLRQITSPKSATERHEITIKFADADTFVRSASVESASIQVFDNQGQQRAAELLSVVPVTEPDPRGNAKEVLAQFAIQGPFSTETDGPFTVSIQAERVQDIRGNFVPGNPIFATLLCAIAPYIAPATAYPTVQAGTDVSVAISFDITSANGLLDVSEISNDTLHLDGQAMSSFTLTPNSDADTVRLEASWVLPAVSQGENLIVRLEENGLTDTEGNVARTRQVGPTIVATAGTGTGDAERFSYLAKDFVSFQDNQGAPNVAGTGEESSVEFIDAGEWIEHLIQVPATGTYRIFVTAASADPASTAKAVTLSSNGESATVDFTGTGAWQSYQEFEGGIIQLTGGEQTIRTTMDTGRFNLRKLRFEPVVIQPQGPRAESGNFPRITADTNSYTFTFDIVDPDSNVDVSTIDSSDVAIASLSGASVSFSLSSTTNTDRVTVTATVSRNFVEADNGTYSVTMPPGVIADEEGNTNATAFNLGSIIVAIGDVASEFYGNYIPEDGAVYADRAVEFVGKTFGPLDKTGDASKASDNIAKFLNMRPELGKEFINQQGLLKAVPIYFPEGVYYFDAPFWTISDCRIYGAGVGKTIFRLKANSPEFNDPNNPVPFIRLGYPQANYRGFGFNLVFHGITIEIEGGNTGCVALEWYGSNMCEVGDLEIIDLTDTALAGIGCRGGSGPGLVSHVTVEGFRYGMLTASGSCFWNLVTKHQRVAGLWNDYLETYANPYFENPGQPPDSYAYGGGVQSSAPIPTLHGWTSIQRNNVPAYAESGAFEGSVLTVHDGDFQHEGSTSSVALRISNSVVLRNCSFSGYSAGLTGTGRTNVGTQLVGQSNVVFYSTYDHSPGGPEPTPITFVPPPVPLTPGPELRWKSVGEAGVNVSDTGDDTAAFQALVNDTSVDVIYVQREGHYQNSGVNLQDTIVISANRGGKPLYINWLGKGFWDGGGNFAGKSIFRIEDTGGPVVFNNMSPGYVDRAFDYTLFEHNSPHPFIFACSLSVNAFSTAGTAGVDLTRVHAAYRSSVANPGDFYCFNVVGGGPFIFDKGNTFYAVQLNWNKPSAARMVPAALLQITNNSKALIVQMRPEDPHEYEGGLVQVGSGGTLQMFGNWNDLQKSPGAEVFAILSPGGNLILDNASFPCGVGRGWGDADPENPNAFYINWVNLIQEPQTGQLYRLVDMHRANNGVHYLAVWRKAN